jgi:uncharacterized protein (TIGR02246 family)
MSDANEVEQLHQRLLACWNDRDAAGYGACFTADGSMVGFDGTCVETPGAIVEHLQSIFDDHEPARYVAKVREVRRLGERVALLRAVVGMVPPHQSDIAPPANAVQSVVAVDHGDAGGWRVAHFHNTPAAFHGRPEAVDALTEELRAVLRSSS